MDSTPRQIISEQEIGGFPGHWLGHQKLAVNKELWQLV